MTLPVVFGANVDPVWHPAAEPLRRARDAERLGLDPVTIQDHHLYQPKFYDAWTLLTYIAAQTEKITVVPTVVGELPTTKVGKLDKKALRADIAARLQAVQ